MIEDEPEKVTEEKSSNENKDDKTEIENNEQKSVEEPKVAEEDQEEPVIEIKESTGFSTQVQQISDSEVKSEVSGGHATTEIKSSYFIFVTLFFLIFTSIEM